VSDRTEINRHFYEDLWRGARFERPERFNTWPLVQPMASGGAPALEVGPGLRPRMPLAGTLFVDSSLAAVARLRAAGGHSLLGDLRHLPFGAGRFPLVAAFDVIEHVEDDASVFRELGRVLAADGCLVCSVPLHASAWTEFDAMVGHCRRYDPREFEHRLAGQGLRVVESAVYGMQPKSRWLLDCGTWMMRHRRAKAMRWYNRVFMPLAIRLQKPLRFVPGLVDDPGVDEIIAVCRRRP
jgi:SAM-dependent methyltransferase